MQPGKELATIVADDGKSVLLRRLGRGDLGELFRFASTLVRERANNPDLGIVSLDRRATRASEREFLRKMIDGIKKRRTISVAAFVEKKLVGTCAIQRRTQHDVEHTGLLGIVILDGYRGKGLGEAMVRTALVEARRVGVWLVELTVFSNNSGAIHLYEKCGFKVVGTIPSKIQRGSRLIDEVVMYVDLRTIDKSPRERTRPV